ncbi:MAG: DUF6473 family protein [Pseudomonadota bacterium]
MNVSNPGAGGLDYAPCSYGTSHLLFRGPQRDLRGKYLAFIGSAETFGTFIREPYPALLEDMLGVPCVNLGLRNAGIDVFLSSPGIIEVASRASMTVIQAMGAVNMSNRLYTVDPRRNHRFIRATKRLKDLYPEVDFREFDLTSQVISRLAGICLDRMQTVRRELQMAWVARMRTLVSEIRGRVVLMWFADRKPYTPGLNTSSLCRDPIFVDRTMMAAVCTATAAIPLEVVAEQADIEAGREEMVFDAFEAAQAAQRLGPICHGQAAEALEPLVSQAL